VNKKLTAKGDDGKIRYCILSGDKDFSEQLYELFDIRKGCGFSVELYSNEIKIVDYYHGETRATLPVLSLEDTELPASLVWTAIDNNG